MLTVVTFLFDGWRHKAQGVKVFNKAVVNTVYKQYRKHLTVPHRFVCVTDEGPEGLLCEHFDINQFPNWPEKAPPNWTNRASDFFRLDMFTDFGKVFGDRVLMTDLDVWVRGNIDHLITDEPFRVLACPYGYCTALYLFTPGARPELAEYNPETWTDEVIALKAAGRFVPGSDQSVVNARARPDEAVYGPEDGVYLISPADHTIPRECRLAMFFGTMKPWLRPEFRADWFGVPEPSKKRRRVGKYPSLPA